MAYIPPTPRFSAGTVVSNGFSVASTGVKFTYTVPAGKVAKGLTGIAYNIGANAYTNRFNAVVGGVSVPISAPTAIAATQVTTFSMPLGLVLAAGDAVNLEVTAAGAASTASALFSVELYDAP